MDLNIIAILLIPLLVLLFSGLSFFLSNQYWVNLLVGSILFGTFFGVLKNGINNQKEDINMTLLLIGCYLVWYFITKLAGTQISKEVELESAKEETEKKGILEMDTIKTGTSSSNIIYLVLLVVIFITLVLYLQYSYLPIAFFLFLSVLFTYISNKRLDFESRSEIISYTISFGIIFGIFAPLFLFNNFKMKNSISNTLIFFAWASLTESTSNFLKPETSYIPRY